MPTLSRYMSRCMGSRLTCCEQFSSPTPWTSRRSICRQVQHHVHSLYWNLKWLFIEFFDVIPTDNIGCYCKLIVSNVLPACSMYDITLASVAQGQNYIFSIKQTYRPVNPDGCSVIASKTKKNILITISVRPQCIVMTFGLLLIAMHDLRCM